MTSGSLSHTENTSAQDAVATSARLLIVDDNRINLKKMQMSARALGHESELAENGSIALDKLRNGSFDVVLLDLVMPEMDGFDVLKALKGDKLLSHIPVIVVTALDEQTDSVVKAIELGAEDVLPKNFNPVLLKARLEASLAKKRYRDQEIEYFKRVESLTQAAEVIESGQFSGDKLELDRLASQPDSLGRLAAVFTGMATEIYNRELKLRRSLHLIMGSFLVVMIGVVWGASPALSRMLAGTGTNPLGLAVWTNLITCVSCLLVATYQGSLPKLTRSDLKFFLLWALIAGVSQRIVTYWVSEHVEATMLSLIITLQGFMVFAFAAITKLEKATPQRLLGLTIGLAGVSLVLWSKFDFSAIGQSIWLLVAILLPLLFAIEVIVLAGKRPERISIFASLGIMAGFSTLMLLPMAMASDNLITFGPSFGKVELLTILVSMASSASIVMALYLISFAGSVFYSQTAYTMTLAGVVWGMLLLGETLPPAAWFAFVLICIGVYLVEPKSTSDDIIIKRSFTTRAEREEKPVEDQNNSGKRLWLHRLFPTSAIAGAAICCLLLINAMVSPPQTTNRTEVIQSYAASHSTTPVPLDVTKEPSNIRSTGNVADSEQKPSANAENYLVTTQKTTLSVAPIKSASAEAGITPVQTAGLPDARMIPDIVKPPLLTNPDKVVPSPTVVPAPVRTTPTDPVVNGPWLPLSENDPFAELIVSAHESELRVVTPEGAEEQVRLSQGMRLQPLAGNGQWFQVKTDRGMVGFVHASDVALAAFRQTSAVYTR